jgi:hypothetical protein
MFIDAHGLKTQGGGGYLKFLPKSLGGGAGGQGFQEKLPGGSINFAFYCIFINKFFKNLPGGAVLYPPSTLTPLCASIVMLN